MQGEPATMQDDPTYDDVVAEVRDYLRDRAAELEALGVAHDRICLDPGPGFGKTASQTVELLRNLHEIARLGYPVMCAASRKSFMKKAYGIDDPLARDEASAAEALMACDLRPYVLLGLGANVALVAHPGEEQEGKIAQLNHAIGQLCLLPDTTIIDIAGFYGSEPAYLADQEEFVNTVVLLRSGLPPLELLDCLQAIENGLGRVREVPNGPRTCDIDILDYQLYHFANDRLTLPHPRICERDFVVKPLLEVRPGHVLADGTPVDSVPESERLGRAWRL